MRRRKIAAFMFATILFPSVTAGVLFMLGPRTPDDTAMTFDAGSIGPDPDAWLAAAEARYADIRPGLAKEIIWDNPAAKTRTPLAIVYLHGFSASKGEVRPLPDQVARRLGANLFFTRLTGHGRTGDAMAEASTADWANDAAQALAIGARLGERTVIIATSTGAALATLALADRSRSSPVAAIVMLSPNFGLKAPGSSLLSAPWARRIAHLVLGERRSFVPLNALHAALWTAEYPVDALLPMAALVKKARATDVSAIPVPALFVFSPQDQVVDAARTASVMSRWGGPTDTVDPEPVDDPFHHVVAGDALSPSTTHRLSETITNWIRKTLHITDKK